MAMMGLKFNFSEVEPPIDFDAMQFRLGILKVNKTNDTTLEMIIPLRRIFHYHISTTFFPTFCLLTIACLTLFIDPERFEAKISLSLTTMLVMQTLQENIGDNLPKTAYNKLIDVWLIIGMSVPFSVFLVLVFIELLPREGRSGEATQPRIVPATNRGTSSRVKVKDHGKRTTKERIHRLFQIVIPTFTTLAAFGYFVIVVNITKCHDKYFD